jgi:hypothetical protein
LSIFFIFSFTPQLPPQPTSWMENAEDYQPFSKVFYDCSLLRISINPFHIAPVYLPLNLMLLETWSLLSRTDFCLCHVPSQRFSIKYDTWTSETGRKRALNLRTMTAHTKHIISPSILGAKHFFLGINFHLIPFVDSINYSLCGLYTPSDKESLGRREGS